MDYKELSLCYDTIRSIQIALETKVKNSTDVDYNDIQALSSAYTILSYLANELAQFPDNEPME